MSQDLLIFCVIIGINTFFSILYFIYNVIYKDVPKERRMEAIIFFVILLLCPVAGFIFLLIAKICYHTVFSNPVDLEGVVFSKERVKAVSRAEEDWERDIVPMEEAIDITGKEELRALLMHLVSDDANKYLSAIASALNSEDSETAHYAASVLQDALNSFSTVVQKQRKELLEHPVEKSMDGKKTVQYMDNILSQNVLPEMEQKNYVMIMDEIMEIVYEQIPSDISNQEFVALCLRLLEMKEYVLCEKWCVRARQWYPDELATYNCQIKLYFNSGQREKFFQVINELKKSSVVIDRETLELIRVFQE